MEAALSLIEDLLRRYGHTYHANLAMIAREQFARAPQVACRRLNDDEWWGGSDAVAAVDLALSGGFSAEGRRDGQRLRAALIEVYATMRDYGERNAQAELCTSQFQKWLTSHI
jgi:hypothetical protein